MIQIIEGHHKIELSDKLKKILNMWQTKQQKTYNELKEEIQILNYQFLSAKSKMIGIMDFKQLYIEQGARL